MKNKYLSIVCFVYSLIIFYVWFNDLLKNFLAPNMQIYLIISSFVFLFIGVVLLLNDIHYNFKYSDSLLLFPLVMIFLCDDGRLSINYASNKFNFSNRDREVIEIDSSIDMENIEIDLDNIYFDIDDSIYSYLADYITYMKGASKFIGKSIRLRGIGVDYSDYLKDRYYAVGKYTITCCAADSEFVGFMVKSNIPIENGKWYEVVGVLEAGVVKEGYGIITVNASSIKKIDDNNEELYVYSCNNYGDGKCSNLLNYDLEY